MRGSISTRVLACVFALTTYVQVAFASGEPQTTDPAALRAIVQSCRSQWNPGVQISYHVAEGDSQEFSAVRTLSWSPSAVKLEYGLPAYQIYRYDHATGVASAFNGGSVVESTNPDSVQFGVLVADYEFALGVYPTRDVGERPPYLNDLVHLLETPGVSILPQTMEAGGLECVVVERRTPGAQGIDRLALRGYYSPAFGYAQVRLEFWAGDACLISTWDSSEFVEVFPGGTALPLLGVYRSFECGTAIRAQTIVEVTRDAAGDPQIVSGAQASTAMPLPAGTWIASIDTGERWQVANDWGRKADALLDSKTGIMVASQPRGSIAWWIGIGIAVLAGTVGMLLRDRWTARKFVAASSGLPGNR